MVWVSFEDCTPWFGCYGHPGIRTPNLDRLAADGTLWTNAFSTAPVCAPARSAVITGMHPVALGTHHMRTDPGEGAGALGVPRYEAVIPHYVKCFPEYLRAAGYWCTNDGKHDYQFQAPVTVWDETSDQWAEDGTAHWRHRPDPTQPFFAVFNLGDTHESRSWEGFFDDADIDPESVLVPPYYPDTPKVRASLARVYASIEHNDAILGDLLQQLDDDGLAESTAVFVWTDHGPLPRGKRWPYDSGIHSPLIVRWPGVVDAGVVTDDLVSTMDLGPTVLSLAGVTVPPYLHGRPFLGPDAAGPRDYVFASRDRYDHMYDTVRASRDARFKYIRHADPNQPYVGWNSFRNHHPIMQELWRLHVAGELEGPPATFMASTRPPEELYDCEADPYEIDNLAADPTHRQVLDRHRAALDRWQHEVGDLGMVPEDVMVRWMWPDGEQPTTSRPSFVVLGGEQYGTHPSADGGEFEGPVVIQLQSATQGASIGWTSDDSDEPRWSVYHEPIRLEPGTTVTLRALAHRIGYRPSAEVGATFTVI
ncbi:MAG: sulfatase-like hydrolase/transferase [Acidimicrobiia bacterium]|nr:sulfatase-like hydrolase/transferase [Acidimicrobiia bacterium]